jgi:hypothetical protein
LGKIAGIDRPRQLALISASFMTHPAQEPSTSREFVKQSSLYQEFLAEREEILKHKWLESEKAGRDIGFEQALVSWVVHHRERWRRSRRLGGN